MVPLEILMIQTVILHKIDRYIGCEGKWAIHPSQIDLANKVMSPLKRSQPGQKNFGSNGTSEKRRKSAVSLDGRLIDIASIRQAEVLVEKAKFH